MIGKAIVATLAGTVVGLTGAFAAPRVSAPLPSIPSPHAAEPLFVEPSESALVGPRARQALLVSEAEGQGSATPARRDVTGRARFVSLHPQVARVTAEGVVLPVGDGTATIKVVIGERAALAAVEVRGVRRPRPVSFKNEVVPVLTRYGCNLGACHGAQYGKGGFKISLLGYDPDVDYAALVKLAKGRRLCRPHPERSLFLLKPTGAVSHGGGQRFTPDSEPYRLLMRWIEEGTPAPQEKEARIVALEVLPRERVMQPREQQRLVVRARFSDGAFADVTAGARLNSLNEGVAEVTADGLVTTTGRGATAIMARYLGQAAVTRITVPFHPSLPTGYRYPETAGFIDDWGTRKWREMGLTPSGLCGDEEFIRRASLDAIGSLPTPAEVQAFLADKAPDKRSRLIDALLRRPEYADYWSVKWGDLLRINRGSLGEKGMWSFYTWLHRTLEENRPVDRWVRELITAQGSTYTNGPANFFRVASNPSELAETTSQVFLGVRLQCARCHHHPFEKWSQDDYYSLAAFFARVGRKGSEEFGIFGGEEVVRLSRSGEVRNPRTKVDMRPRALDGPVVDDPLDRRRALAAWITSKNNLMLPRNIVNRCWSMLMGRGLVEPVDDMRVTNPPSNPELLDALARDFVQKGYDLKALLRAIMNSRVYQLSSEATPENRADEMFYSHYRVKRLPAETLLDAIDTATGTTEKFANLPAGTRAIQLPDASVDSYFLDTFGRPPRQIACECERTGEPNIAQALHLMNSDLVNGKLARKEGRIQRLLASGTPTGLLVRDLYLAALSRPPHPIETATALRLMAKAPSFKEGVEDLLWTLLNTREFLFNH
jgi:hypothetical protein